MKASRWWILPALLTSLCMGLCGQSGTAPTSAELLKILRITTFRVYTPAKKHHVWDIKVLEKRMLRPAGKQPNDLTKRTGLLSFRDKGNDVYEFTLPERDGGYSQGDFELCKEVQCGGQYLVKWLKRPIYSADGSQCVLAEFSNLEDEAPWRYIVLVNVKNIPE